MNLGRPAMVNAAKRESFSLPSEVDYEDSSVVQPTGATSGSVLTFFVASTKLYQIAQKILLSFYSDEHTGQTRGYEPYFEEEASVFHFERELQRWCDDVPEHLVRRSGTVPGEAQSDWQMTFRRQAVVLRLRCVFVPYTRLMLTLGTTGIFKSGSISFDLSSQDFASLNLHRRYPLAISKDPVAMI